MGTATITEWTMGTGPSSDPGAVSLVVDFDPQTLELTYSTTGTAPDAKKTSAGTWNKSPSQQTGQSASLSVTLLFDTSTETDVSVQTKTDALVLLTLPNDITKPNPKRRVIQFLWGSFVFYGCVEQMTQTIDFFSDSGVPLRASIHLTIAQVGPPNTPSDPGGGQGSGQGFGANAGIGASASFGASASVGASASFGASVGTTPLTLSMDGDSVQGIAARADASVSWKAIASANNIDNPRLLPPGTVLSTSAGAQFSASAG